MTVPDGTQACRVCGAEKPLNEFRRGERGKPTKECKVCVNARQRAWYEKNKEHARQYAREFQNQPERAERRRKYNRERYYNLTVQERHKDCKLQRQYGITLDEYNEMLTAQGNACAVCRTTCKSGRQLAVDHCHETGRIRGLLCMNCNRGLGWLGEDAGRLMAAAVYIIQTRDVLKEVSE